MEGLHSSRQVRFQLQAKFFGNHERISNEKWCIFCLCSGYITTLWENQTQDSDCSPFLQEEDINTVYSAVAPIRLYDIQLIVKFEVVCTVQNVIAIDFY